MMATVAADPADYAWRRRVSLRFPGRWLQGYVRGKLGSDPVYAATATALATTPAPVLDVGCGIGLLAHYLRQAGLGYGYLGIDPDARKIAIARAASESGSGLCFELGSGSTLPPWQGHVTLLDMLHYLEPASQRALLLAAGARLLPGASLVIRNVLRDRSWRFGLTRCEEFVVHSARWMRFRALHYPSAVEISDALHAAGLEVTIMPLWGHTPFNSYLAIARRAAP